VLVACVAAAMPFTLTQNEEDATTENLRKIFNKLNAEGGSWRDAGPLNFTVSHEGGRCYLQGWDDFTMHPSDGIPHGGRLISLVDPVPEHKVAALAAALKRNDVAAAKSALGISRLGATKTSVEVDLGGKCMGQKAVETFMKALPENLESLIVNLKCNMLMLPGITAVAAGLPKNLKTLKIDLTQNKLQVQGVEVFMKALPKSLTILTLGCGTMRMGLPGVKVIADNLPPNLSSLYIDLHDGLIGDEGVIYLGQKLPKTLTELEIHMRGDQGYLTSKGHWYFDRLLDDPANPYNLPNLDKDNYRVVRNQEYECVQQFGITEQNQRLVRRWENYENVC
jgi:hypothetical protein